MRFFWASPNIHWYNNTKTEKYLSCYLFLSLLEQVVYFPQIDHYSIIFIIYSYLQKLSKIDVLKNFPKFTGKHLFRIRFWSARSLLLFNMRLWHRYFLVNFTKLSRTTFLQSTSGLLLLYLWNISVIS